MRNRLLVVIPFVVLAAVAGCAYKSQRLYQPAPITVYGQKDLATVGTAIRKALERRDWVVTRDEPGVIEAKQTKRAFWASIRVLYDTRSARVQYLDSEHLNYSKTASGEERIHAHYNVWARNVEKDLKGALME